MRPGTSVTIPDSKTVNRYGEPITHPGLPGRWTVWSQTDDCPGAHAVTPADDTARKTGVSYAVVRATRVRGASTPLVQLIRTEPTRK